jgi:hypothetical protein
MKTKQFNSPSARISLHVAAILKNPRKGKFYLCGILREFAEPSPINMMIVGGFAWLAIVSIINHFIK